MKRFISFLMLVCITVSVFSACSQPPAKAPNAEPESTSETVSESSSAPETKAKLTFMSNMVGVPSEALEKACQDFTAKTGIEVEYTAPGANYEELMKTKMSSKDLPDLWTTHGWSVARYSEYLMPINDQPFAKDISNSIKPVITAPDGSIYVLPIDVDLAGIVYNEDVLAKSDVNVDDIKTWDDFEKACAKIKAAGFTPVHIGGKDSWTIGQFFDWAAPSFYITNDSKNFRKEFKDGTFDWNNWSNICEMLDRWNQQGYINVDSLTSDYLTTTKSLGEGKVAFGFFGNYAIMDSQATNPEAVMGMMPVPASDPADTPTLIGGERLAIGVYKDTPNKEAALELLNYLASPEVCAALATANGNPAGLNNVKSVTGDLQKYYDKYASVRTFPYFDREYLPSGMWDDMCITGANILSKQPNAIPDAIKLMEQSFSDKFAQK